MDWKKRYIWCTPDKYVNTKTCIIGGGVHIYPGWGGGRSFRTSRLLCVFFNLRFFTSLYACSCVPLCSCSWIRGDDKVPCTINPYEKEKNTGSARTVSDSCSHKHDINIFKRITSILMYITSNYSNHQSEIWSVHFLFIWLVLTQHWKIPFYI